MWPWPNDSREDRARRVALSYRQLVELIAAGRIEDAGESLTRLDAKWSELGQGWVRPTHAPLDTDAWLAPAELAELLHIDARNICHWARRGHIRPAIDGRYNVGDVIRYGARMRRS